MLQNARVTAFTIFELLRENQLEGGGGKITPTHPPRGDVKLPPSPTQIKQNERLPFQQRLILKFSFLKKSMP